MPVLMLVSRTWRRCVALPFLKACLWSASAIGGVRARAAESVQTAAVSFNLEKVL